MAYLVSASRYLPGPAIRNDELIEIPARYRELIREKAGILTRHFAPEGICTSDLGAEAVRRLIAATATAPGEIDVLICTTSSPDRVQPPTATRIQQLSGLARAYAFDVNAVCSGGVFGLRLAAALVDSKAAAKVIVVAAEMYSRFLDHSDVGTYPYFGDGASAVLVSTHGEFELVEFLLGTDGAAADLIQVPAGGTMLPARCVQRQKDLCFKMRGKEVFDFAARRGAEVVRELTSRVGSSADRIITHQANKKIIEEIAVRSGEPLEKFFVNVDRYANTAGASAFIALSECLEDSPEAKSILLSVFGGGLSWGGAFLRAR